MDESFHFALLRISVSQILKANGFEKCKPSTLNIVTDLYIQYLKKLIDQVNQCVANKNCVEVIDVFQALSLIGTVKPSTFIKLPRHSNTTTTISTSDIDKQEKVTNTKSIESFKNWIEYSDEFRLSYKLNQIPNNLINNLIEKRKLDVNDGETDQERRKRKRKERQEYYNQLNLIDQQNPNSQMTMQHSTSQFLDGQQPDDEDKLTNKDKLLWINYLIEKDLKLGHDLKFMNTSLETEFLKFQSNLNFHPDQQNIQGHNLNKHDYVIINIDDNVHEDDLQQPPPQLKNDDPQVQAVQQNEVRPSEELNKLLPYNIKYNKMLLEDNIDQFISHSDNKHETVPPSGDNGIFEDQDIIQQGDDDIIINEEGVSGDNSLIF